MKSLAVGEGLPMTNVQEILCPKCHASNPRHVQHCQQCRHEVILKSATRYYHITHVIKQGGQGAVFRALGNDRYTCAIKQMLDRFTDPHERNEAVKRFKAESDILQRLRHPCIPNIYDIFEAQGYHYLVMEFVRGSDLEDIIRREQSIPEARALQWADQICDVLEYLHRQQPPIIFRDLKPSNIMIDSDGNVKLIDFGIAKVFQPLQVGTQIGTPGYAPPEQYQGIATPQSDIFALGATLHHMLTGRDPRHEPPFSFPPVYALRPDISRRTSDAIQKAVQMKPEDRYSSVAEFRQALLPSIPPIIPLPGGKLPHQPIPPVAPSVTPQPSPVAPSPQPVPYAAPSLQPRPHSPVAPPTQPSSLPPASMPPSAPSRSTHFSCLGVGAAIATVLVLGFLWMFGLIPPESTPPIPISRPDPTLTPSLVSTESASLPPPQVATTSASVALPPSPVLLTLPQGLERATVTNVTDGDTIEVSLNGQKERVSLIGVDTPETLHPSRPVECFGREASAFTRELLRGQTVLLEDDPTQDNRDRFNRLLRFVWLPDGRLVNYEIIAQGYGFEYTFRTPHRYQAQFKAAERAAREAQIGLWAPETCNGERIAADAVTPVVRTTPTAALEVTPLPPSFDGCRTEPNAALAPNAPVAIVAIDKRAEVVTLRNVSTATVNLDGWTMCSIRGAQIHPGIGGTLAPGETRDFPRAGGGNIWTDSASDPGALYDAEGRLIAYWPD